MCHARSVLTLIKPTRRSTHTQPIHSSTGRYSERRCSDNRYSDNLYSESDDINIISVIGLAKAFFFFYKLRDVSEFNPLLHDLFYNLPSKKVFHIWDAMQ